MTPNQMRYFINHLAASSHEQGRRRNYGVGAKIAAGSRNPHGLEYRSWHRGRGALVRFRRHADGRWGLEPQLWADGRTDFWRPLGEDDKPWLLRGREHGTQVVLLGSSERDDTTKPPRAAVEAHGHWVARYLNTRFLSLPTEAEVLVREGHLITPRRREPGTLQVIHGQSHHLQRRAVAAGIVDLSDARVHWWVLDQDDRGRTAEALRWNSSGHAAALLDDELYEVLPKTRGGYQRVQEFGVRFGYDRVVLYLEPRVDDRDRLESNTARTLLLIDNEPLPWGRWAEEFRTAMPTDIDRLQERVAGDTGGTARRENIRARLRAPVALSPQPVPAFSHTAPAASECQHRRSGHITDDRSSWLARRWTAGASCGRRPRSGCARRHVGPAQRRPARYSNPRRHVGVGPGRHPSAR
jgi:hypothetical protein